jgi:inhibitor of cysteine peptidase
MMKKIRILLILLISVIAVSGCAAEQRPRDIAAAVGDEFILTLSSNKTTGYEWQLSRPLDGGMLKLVKNDYLTDKVDTKRLGAGGQEEWTFRVLKAGKSTISMKYIRPWEKGVKPAREKTFTVIAR